MPIVAGDIDFHLSGGAANSNLALSFGGTRSSVQITDASLHNLFDLVTSAEASAGAVEYRLLYVRNAHATLALDNAKVWISVNTPSPDTTIAIALAGEGLNGVAEQPADVLTPPSGEVFSTPTTEGAGLSLGSITATGHYGVWIRRTVTAGAAAYTGDSAILTVKGDTAA